MFNVRNVGGTNTRTTASTTTATRTTTATVVEDKFTQGEPVEVLRGWTWQPGIFERYTEDKTGYIVKCGKDGTSCTIRASKDIHRLYAFQLGDRLRVDYFGQSHEGTLKGFRFDNKKCYGVQCDSDKTGVITWCTFRNVQRVVMNSTNQTMSVFQSQALPNAVSLEIVG